jgi:hypothetical protein
MKLWRGVWRLMAMPSVNVCAWILRATILEVVGVVRDAKYDQLAERPVFFGYRPLSQRYRGAMTLHVRTTSDPLAAVNQVRAEVRGA